MAPSTLQNREEKPGLPKKEPVPIGVWAGPAIFFVLAAGCFYLAYIGLVSGTSYKTTRPPNGHRGEVIYGGVDTREEHPGKFWSEEAIFCVCGVTFGVGGVRWLREEYQRRRLPQEKC